MKNNKHKFSMLLQKGIKYSSFFAIALFVVLQTSAISTSSAGFRYSEFDWDNFAEQNKTYWEGYCIDKPEEEQKDCKNEILKSQKKFYKKLYKILAKYDKKGIYIIDNVIIETVFFELTPSSFSDDGSEYKSEWESSSGAYEIDESEGEEVDIEVDFNNPDMAEYFAEEKDTLKTLIKNVVAYTTNCYGVYGNPTIHTREDGSTYPACESGGEVMTVLGKEKCADRINSYKLGFWEYYVSRWAYDRTLLTNIYTSFLGLFYDDEHYHECMGVSGNYPEGTSYTYDDGEDPEANYQKYWNFLLNNTYFDKKAHLQERYKEKVLIPAGVSCMTEDICSDSLEATGRYKEFDGAIKEIRREIIDDIIYILKEYGIDVPFSEVESDDFVEMNQEQSTRKTYYWPIGSDETEERDGIIYADGEPASMEVISYFGNRTNSVTGEEEFHYGIDISGVVGTTNIVAVYNGEVISVVSSCSNGNYDCNDGYGNTIIIAHPNGDYTVYAHLDSIDASVSVGASVKKGQVIGKLGQTGRTKTASLHYELRVGGNDITYAVDPLGIFDTKNPRPNEASGDFSVHYTSLTREEFISKMSAYCNRVSCSTTFRSLFVMQAGLVYDVSVANNVNPELVVVRALVEGLSPGGSSNNYWGIGCYNGVSKDKCSHYSTFENGIKGFAKTVSKYEMVSDMMNKYAYIGDYWYNPGGWGLGGCPYFPHISKYMSDARYAVGSRACGTGAPSCGSGGKGNCTKTTSEDQKAYAIWQINDKMVPYRYNIFGL